MKQNPLENKLSQLKKPKQEKLDLKVELATPKDWAQLKDIELESIRNHPDAFFVQNKPVLREHLKWLEKFSKGNWISSIESQYGFYILAKNGLHVIGFIEASCKAFDETGTTFQGKWGFKSLYVKPDFRNRNIGESLIKAGLEELRRRHGQDVGGGILKTNKNLKKVHDLLVKMGFKEDGESDSSMMYLYDLTK